MTYEQAAAYRDHLERTAQAASAALQAISGGGPMGLTPDGVRASPEWQARKRAYDLAHAALRAFNSWFVPRFGKRDREERAARRAERRL